MLGDLAPSPSRVDDIDSLMRTRLADSLEYLGGLPWFEPNGRAAVFGLLERLKTDPVSPWVFCLYSRLVMELSKGIEGTGESLYELEHAASLPADEGVTELLDCTIPKPWWDHFQLLLDTDQTAPFRP